MAKQLLKFLLSLALLPLFATNAEGQTHLVSKTEIVGDYDGNSYTLLTDLKGYTLIRTDENGSMIWSCPLKVFKIDSLDFISNQSRFIVAGITNYFKKTDRIKANPGDYDYWLIPISDLTDGFFCRPNPTLGNTNVVINIESKIEIFRLYNSDGKLIFTIQTPQNGQFDLDLNSYKSGAYFLEGLDNKGFSIQTIKIIKQ
jgi:hypothetical protein